MMGNITAAIFFGLCAGGFLYLNDKQDCSLTWADARLAPWVDRSEAVGWCMREKGWSSWLTLQGDKPLTIKHK